MSLIKERRGRETYYTFQMGTGKKLYLGPQRAPDPGRVERAEEYVRSRIQHYNEVLRDLKRLKPVSEEEFRQREEIRALTRRLNPDELRAIVRLSLAETGLSPYELERGGIRPVRILSMIEKLSEFGLIQKKTETRTPAGRKLVRYTATPIGAQLAFEHLASTSRQELTEQKLSHMAEGDFKSTPLGALYSQLETTKIRDESMH